MTRDLEGKTAFVTGSGRGLGHVIARALSSMGAALVIHDRSWNETARFGEAPNLGDALKVILESGAQAMTVTGDVSDRAAVGKMREDIEARMGQVDILVNCAGGDIGASGTKPEPNTVLGIPYGCRREVGWN